MSLKPHYWNVNFEQFPANYRESCILLPVISSEGRGKICTFGKRRYDLTCHSAFHSAPTPNPHISHSAPARPAPDNNGSALSFDCHFGSVGKWGWSSLLIFRSNSSLSSVMSCENLW